MCGVGATSLPLMARTSVYITSDLSVTHCYPDTLEALGGWVERVCLAV